MKHLDRKETAISVIRPGVRRCILACLGLLAAAGMCAGADVFRIVLLPDTQQYTDDDLSASLLVHFTNQTQWIVDNRVGSNIVFASHLGDIVQYGSRLTEWASAETAMSILDAGAPDLPYGVVLGNHDTDPIYAANGSASNYVAYFGSARYAGKSWYGGADSDQRNHYQVFSGGARQFLNIALEWRGCSTENADYTDVIAWAQGVIDAYPDYPTIISTHEYLSASSRTTAGNDIFNTLVTANPQVFMVVCGHADIGRSTAQNDSGDDVFQILANYQGYANGGNGYLRILEFDEDAGQIRNVTYSPSLDQYVTDGDNQFALTVDFKQRFGSEAPYVTAEGGATNMTGSTADLTGYLVSTGGAATEVYTFWGTTDGFDEAADWGNTNHIDSDGVGLLTCSLSKLAANTRYYYRFYATNALGDHWTGPSESFITPGVIPFTEDFEERLEGDLDGQHGWTATGAAVQTKAAVEGVQAVGIEGWHSEASHLFEEGCTQVWTDLRCRPEFGTPLRYPPAGSTFAFYVNTNGVVVAFDGRTQTQLVDTVVQSNEWARFTVHSDHVNTNWSLWVNGVSAASGLGFYSAGSGSYGALVVNGSATGTTYMDKLSIGLSNPLSRPSASLYYGR